MWNNRVHGDWPQYVLGIDPGVKTGFAVYDRGKRELRICDTLSFWDTVDKLEEFTIDCGLSGFEVILEDNSANATFRGRGRNPAAHSAMEKISRNVGSVQRDQQLLVEYMISKGIKHRLIKPTHSTTKMNDELFKKITGWKARTSSHSRDAGILCWQR